MNADGPVAMLMTEHRLIERVIGVMRRTADGIARGTGVDPRRVATIAEFLRAYADECHHGKEEDILFAALTRRELSSDDAHMMDGLIQEHAWARKTTRRLTDSEIRYSTGETDALDDVRRSLIGLAEMYPRHIEKEDTGFFPASRSYFSDAEWERMAEAFREFDRRLVHERYARIADSLEADTREPSRV